MKITKTKEFLNSLVCSNGKNEKVSFFNLRRILAALALENQEVEKEVNKEKEMELKLYDNVKLDDLFYEEEKIRD